MITSDEILARMRKGETADDIANEMAKALNAAQKVIEEEKSKSKKEQWFKEACAVAASSMNNALDAYGGWKGIDVDDLTWDADMCADIIKIACELNKVIDVHPDPKDMDTLESFAKNVKDTFDWFLKENGLK